MPKVGSVWFKQFTDPDGGIGVRHSGKVNINGESFFIDLYPQPSNATADSPSFTVYMKPVQKGGGSHDSQGGG